MLTGERGEQTCGRIADEERDSLLQNGESVSTLLSAELDSYLVQVSAASFTNCCCLMLRGIIGTFLLRARARMQCMHACSVFSFLGADEFSLAAAVRGE